ncbi:MAG: hypothetical protein ACT4OZ_08120 [Gemmatimonadota bacterium]
MQITDVEVTEADQTGSARLSARVVCGGVRTPVTGRVPGATRERSARANEGERVWFEVDSGIFPSPSGDAFVAAMAPLAATLSESIVTDAPVDELLRAGVTEVSRVWRSWYPATAVVGVDAPQSTAAPSRGRTAAFFTGGVDSFFTILRHRAGEGTPSTLQIDDLVYVHGFDLPLDATAGFRRVRDSLGRAAEQLEARLVCVATNLRETAFARTDWSRLSHGAALAGVAHAIGSRYDTVLIASSAGYRDLRFWGSHPLTDPMFSSSSTRIVHDGAAAMRTEKTEYVAPSAIAQRHLRVCWKSLDGGNCGRCNNCYRTMMALDAIGVLDKFVTFEASALDYVRARRIFCRHDYDTRQFGYVLDLARRNGRSDIATAVQAALEGSGVLRSRIELLRRMRDWPILWRWAPFLERRLLRNWID